MRVAIADVVAWLSAIPYEEWPQQAPIAGKLRPAMVADPDWHNFGTVTQALIDEAMADRDGRPYRRMLSVVMPGQSIAPHRDEQPEVWCGRAHVPLLSNERALFIIAGKSLHMRPGHVYWVDTREMHEVVNGGDVPRVHLMFDVRRFS